MASRRRTFKRPLGERRYRKLFVIAVEGVKTEPQYFAIFNDQTSVIRVNCLKGGHDSPPCQDWPRTPGSTTVYKLVANLLKL